jgi:hypothetical protein
VVKGSGNSQKVHKKIVPFPTGFTVLPEEGGMLDQPYRLMEYFGEFIRGERQAQYKELSS